MKTDYVFGDRVKVLPKLDETTDYSNKVYDGDTGFVLGNTGSTFPVEVQFVGYTEVFMYEELEFLGSNIEDE
jgi:ribosomal protein L21E